MHSKQKAVHLRTTQRAIAESHSRVPVCAKPCGIHVGMLWKSACKNACVLVRCNDCAKHWHMDRILGLSNIDTEG